MILKTVFEGRVASLGGLASVRSGIPFYGEVLRVFSQPGKAKETTQKRIENMTGGSYTLNF